MKKSLLLTHKKALILCTVLSVVVVVFACAHSNEKINMDVQNFDESSLRIENYGSSATDDDIDIIYNKLNSHHRLKQLKERLFLLKIREDQIRFCPEMK